MNDESARVRRIIERMTELTRRRSLVWHEAAPSSFETTLASGHMARVLSEDADDMAPFQFMLLQSDGRPVEILRSTPYDEMPADALEELRLENSALESVFNTARDSALGISDALADIERDLGLG